MRTKELIPVFVVSGLLLLFNTLITVDGLSAIAGLIFLSSPFLIIWMIYAVLRFGKSSGKSLEKDEEWGYADKEKNDVGVF